jgi:F-type H+-transporting ATPase subunit delta
MFEQRVSSRYAKAMLQTAVKEGVADTLYKDFNYVNSVLDMSAELRSMTHSPVIRNWKKKNIYKELFESKINKLTMEFIIMLANKRRDGLIPSIINQYIIQYNIMNNLLPVEITTIDELDSLMKSKVEKQLTDWSKKKIIPSYILDNSIKGGILIKVDDWVYDASVKHQLELLHERLISGE